MQVPVSYEIAMISHVFVRLLDVCGGSYLLLTFYLHIFGLLAGSGYVTKKSSKTGLHDKYNYLVTICPPFSLFTVGRK
jgi:hypothetical protein